jgi:ribosomal protein S27E
VNPLFQWVVTHATIKALARDCPSCKRTQVVPRSRQRESVTCKHCGAKIPPKSAAARR